MTRRNDNVVALATRVPSLERRVHRKREVLQQWLDEGVPHDKLASLPRSLNDARKWADVELGIYAVGSPNNFTCGHRDVGRDVEAIRSLLEKLHAKLKRPPARRRAIREIPAISSKEVEQTLAALISQWHMARHEASTQRARAKLAEKHRDRARDEVRRLEQENAELRRKAFGGLSVVE